MGLSDLLQIYSPKKTEFQHDSVPVCIVALAYYLLDANGLEHKNEQKRLTKIFNSQLNLDEDQLKKLLQAAKNAYNNVVDIFSFANVIAEKLNEKDRILFIRFLFDLAYCDGNLDELEDNVIWRISELIGIDEKNQLQQKKAAANHIGRTL